MLCAKLIPLHTAAEQMCRLGPVSAMFTHPSALQATVDSELLIAGLCYCYMSVIDGYEVTCFAQHSLSRFPYAMRVS